MVVSDCGTYMGPLQVASVRPRVLRDGPWVRCWLGFRLDIVAGSLKRPVGRLYHWQFWAGDKRFNPWNGEKGPWFVIALPVAIGVFVSAMFGRWGNNVPGFYFGLRTADWSNPVDWQLRLDWSKPDSDRAAWAWDEHGRPVSLWAADEDRGRKYLEPTLALRANFDD